MLGVLRWRARRAGADAAPEVQRFAIADDMAYAGLLVAYLAIVPFCVPGTVDLEALQRLFESTFRLDFAAIRCAASG
jgi:hypothetical protein